MAQERSVDYFGLRTSQSVNDKLRGTVRGGFCSGGRVSSADGVVYVDPFILLTGEGVRIAETAIEQEALPAADAVHTRYDCVVVNYIYAASLPAPVASIIVRTGAVDGSGNPPDLEDGDYLLALCRLPALATAYDQVIHTERTLEQPQIVRVGDGVTAFEQYGPHELQDAIDSFIDVAGGRDRAGVVELHGDRWPEITPIVLRGGVTLRAASGGPPRLELPAAYDSPVVTCGDGISGTCNLREGTAYIDIDAGGLEAIAAAQAVIVVTGTAAGAQDGEYVVSRRMSDTRLEVDGAVFTEEPANFELRSVGCRLEGVRLVQKHVAPTEPVLLLEGTQMVRVLDVELQAAGGGAGDALCLVDKSDGFALHYVTALAGGHEYAVQVSNTMLGSIDRLSTLFADGDMEVRFEATAQYIQLGQIDGSYNADAGATEAPFRIFPDRHRFALLAGLGVFDADSVAGLEDRVLANGADETIQANTPWGYICKSLTLGDGAILRCGESPFVIRVVEDLQLGAGAEILAAPVDFDAGLSLAEWLAQHNYDVVTLPQTLPDEDNGPGGAGGMGTLAAGGAGGTGGGSGQAAAGVLGTLVPAGAQGLLDLAGVGGSAGAAGSGTGTAAGGDGGKGGGVLLLVVGRAIALAAGAAIRADGGAGLVGGSAGATAAGGGGGGGGGVLVVRSLDAVTGLQLQAGAQLSAKGGAGAAGANNTAVGGGGGGGAGGVLWVEAPIITGDDAEEPTAFDVDGGAAGASGDGATGDDAAAGGAGTIIHRRYRTPLRGL